MRWRVVLCSAGRARWGGAAFMFSAHGPCPRIHPKPPSHALKPARSQANPTEIFSKTCGFYLRHSDEVPSQAAKGWDVTTLIFSKEKTRKHEVGVVMATFWATLRHFLARNQPHVLVRSTEGNRDTHHT